MFNLKNTIIKRSRFIYITKMMLLMIFIFFYFNISKGMNCAHIIYFNLIHHCVESLQFWWLFFFELKIFLNNVYIGELRNDMMDEELWSILWVIDWICFGGKVMFRLSNPEKILYKSSLCWWFFEKCFRISNKSELDELINENSC